MTSTMEHAEAVTPHNEDMSTVVEEERGDLATRANVKPEDNEFSSDAYTWQCETQLAVLGVLVGLLMIVLVVMTTGWAWTCWMMKKRGAKRQIQIEQDRYIWIWNMACIMPYSESCMKRSKYTIGPLHGNTYIKPLQCH